jgi:hypothetical protein
MVALSRKAKYMASLAASRPAKCGPDEKPIPPVKPESIEKPEAPESVEKPESPEAPVSAGPSNSRKAKYLRQKYAQPAASAAKPAQCADYPWDQCISDQKKKGYSDDVAAKICGTIKKNAGASVAAGPLANATSQLAQQANASLRSWQSKLNGELDVSEIAEIENGRSTVQRLVAGLVADGVQQGTASQFGQWLQGALAKLDWDGRQFVHPMGASVAAATTPLPNADSISDAMTLEALIRDLLSQAQKARVVSASGGRARQLLVSQLADSLKNVLAMKAK